MTKFETVRVLKYRNCIHCNRKPKMTGPHITPIHPKFTHISARKPIDVILRYESLKRLTKRIVFPDRNEPSPNLSNITDANQAGFIHTRPMRNILTVSLTSTIALLYWRSETIPPAVLPAGRRG